MKSAVFLGFISLATLIGCSQAEKEIPDYVWEEGRFVEVLTEFQKAESVVRLGYGKSMDSLYASDSIYQAVFDKLGVEEEAFDSNYQYYLSDPERMEKIYDQVITRLSEEAAAIEQRKEDESAIEKPKKKKPKKVKAKNKKAEKKEEKKEDQDQPKKKKKKKAKEKEENQPREFESI